MCLCYEHAHFSDDDDERAVQVCLKMKEMSVLLSGFITLNSGVFYTLLSSAIPPFHLSVFKHRYSNPPLGCQIPLSMAQWSHLHPETSTNRITMMLKGLWWGNWDKSAEFHRGCSIVPPRTDFLAANLILNIRGFSRQMNASPNAFSHSRTLINWRSNHFECLHVGLSHTGTIEEETALVCFSVSPSLMFWRWSCWENWPRLAGSGWTLCYFSLCFILFSCGVFFSTEFHHYIFQLTSSDLGWLVSVDFFQTGFCDEGRYCINKSDF